MDERTNCGHQTLCSRLAQDLIAVHVIVDQARLALPAEAGGLRDALAAAAGTLDADLEAVRAMDRLKLRRGTIATMRAPERISR